MLPVTIVILRRMRGVRTIWVCVSMCVLSQYVSLAVFARERGCFCANGTVCVCVCVCVVCKRCSKKHVAYGAICIIL